MWVLVVLTLSGGASATHGTLDACTRAAERALDANQTGELTEVYCMNGNGSTDRVYAVHHGKRVRLE